jgi:predicted  nucleic acid-binding Zn-ribbon protein
MMVEGGDIMAMSTCMKCGNHTFEMVEREPRGSRFKLMFVQCTMCGGVVGVMDYYNIGAQTEQIKAALKKVARQIGVSVDF